MKPRMLEKYQGEAAPALHKEFGYSNPMEIPRLVKIVINIGVGEGKQDAKYVNAAMSELATIAGQRPMMKRAKKSIAGFKLREGVPVGCSVTLRGSRMWEFLDRLVSVVLPRIKDFRGISGKAFDGRGNYNLGLKEQIIFPEIDYDKIMVSKGMNITFVSTANTDEEGLALLSKLGMPFAR
ncbi:MULTISPECIES: 50S ribosomal protein L5 [Dethiosulfovibrio]|uniref:Large ribosomal subunit protein uL5 n=3 Tax=Dethiosulfovibrio TaxID=47054 RepID=D2Z925_9BACT|nr:MULTISPECIES: 50S ribosomal protein L5 [Dethiosulfovibrio]MEA3285500.1 50S ribosomal protein L5 [Synergistota bacterium]EFC91972.1 ribosomal protein L5 [Dethiosulfovibrio peptidovorans DSM 11002]MCF4113018.1 50S ribosomal protein L5 [Dethiosulfovibrio russensis]MCF4141482.1 50S ribosomal protein L5 [Dethiosulfovibrio marinus]MCF4144438.1 50S ribosomal protein L5 [Dethiosulfovibrio acidaminovorans]